jgi:hypothetical protein
MEVQRSSRKSHTVTDSMPGNERSHGRIIPAGTLTARRGPGRIGRRTPRVGGVLRDRRLRDVDAHRDARAVDRGGQPRADGLRARLGRRLVVAIEGDRAHRGASHHGIGRDADRVRRRRGRGRPPRGAGVRPLRRVGDRERRHGYRVPDDPAGGDGRGRGGTGGRRALLDDP